MDIHMHKYLYRILGNVLVVKLSCDYISCCKISVVWATHKQFLMEDLVPRRVRLGARLLRHVARRQWSTKGLAVFEATTFIVRSGQQLLAKYSRVRESHGTPQTGMLLH